MLPLHGIHGLIGPIQQLVSLNTVSWRDCRACARHQGQVQILVPKIEGLAHDRCQPCHPLGNGFVIIDRQYENGEFIPTQTGNRIGDSRRSTEMLGKCHDGRIPGPVAIVIIDRLEAIHIDHQDTHAEAIAHRNRQGTAQPIKKQRSIRQPGHLIMGGSMEEIVFSIFDSKKNGCTKHLGQQLQNRLIPAIKWFRLSSNQFDDTDNQVTKFQWDDQQRADPLSTAGIAINIRVDFAIITKEGLARSDTQARKTRTQRQPDA